ncbi:alkaline phytoceramidase [Fistulina hepatica ATCC 64428]|uniref:Alkaline phytoceramidase n=1 Tax=Fistulina hepatica ATCC 64428 TaxID=1128425 RepID=A0A0D7AGQ1_9AGAR|nr:alkaline phytoceramidase [Fistulina hepatica ATCC 64428]
MAINHPTVNLSRIGVYGPVTATLDWCEPNHMFSPHIAEMANTLSNLYTISISVLGLANTLREHLPQRFLLGYLGIAFVGIGSFIFHATLLWGAQLMDELPMIYVAALSLWMISEDGEGFTDSKQSQEKQASNNYGMSARAITSLLLFDVLFTASYYAYRNPVYHQCVFASLLLSLIYRVASAIRTSNVHPIPADLRRTITRLFASGAALFAFGFLIWNLDNVFCPTLTRYKQAVGWPGAFLLEGHSWWHIFTGAGTYYMFIGMQCNTLAVKDDHRNYKLGRRWGLPVTVRSPKGWEAIGLQAPGENGYKMGKYIKSE